MIQLANEEFNFISQKMKKKMKEESRNVK